MCALLLAVMTAWSAHASTSLIGSHLATSKATQHPAHGHDDHCADHAHTLLMGDHQHEVPHLGTPASLKERLIVSFAMSDLPYPLPNAPFFQKKRPPRPQLVI
jgi:hypothetical protein